MAIPSNDPKGHDFNNEIPELFEEIKKILNGDGEVKDALSALEKLQTKTKVIEDALCQVMAQVVRPDDYGTFYISPEAADILKEAARLAGISWKFVAPPFNKRPKEFRTTFKLEKGSGSTATTTEPYRYIEGLIQEAAIDIDVNVATAIDPETKEILHRYKRP